MAFRTFRTVVGWGCALGLLASVGSGRLTAAASKPEAKAEAMPLPVAPIFPPSAFVEDPKSSKDPFFPTSTRRGGKVSQPGPKPSPKANPSSELALKGFLDATSRPLALINGQTLAVGDEARIRVSSGLVKVKCLEIRSKSVIISVEGEAGNKELFLRSGS